MKTSLTILFSISISFLFGQLDTIHFTNPSFEGQPLEGVLRNGSFLKGWTDCGFRARHLQMFTQLEVVIFLYQKHRQMEIPT